MKEDEVSLNECTYKTERYKFKGLRDKKKERIIDSIVEILNTLI
jgi:hypothetical protein